RLGFFRLVRGGADRDRVARRESLLDAVVLRLVGARLRREMEIIHRMARVRGRAGRLLLLRWFAHANAAAVFVPAIRPPYRRIRRTACLRGSRVPRIGRAPGRATRRRWPEAA